MQRILVLLPTYNEAANLESMVEAILHATAGLGDTDLLIIDDNSPDGTGQIADALQVRHPHHLHVLHRAAKEGLGRAYAAGYAWAAGSDYNVIAQMDADFSHDPDDLPRLVAAITDGADVAIGSRYVPGGQTPGWAWRRRLLSRTGSRYAALVLGLPVHDLTGGFKAFSPRALRLIAGMPLHAAGFGVQIETTTQAYRHGLEVREVPIIFRDRRAGSSKMSRAIVLEGFALPWKLRSATAPQLPGAAIGPAPTGSIAASTAGTRRVSSAPPDVAA